MIIDKLFSLTRTSCSAKLAQIFIALGADVNYDNGIPLRAVCYDGNFSVAKILLENGASPNLLGGAALRRAIKRNNTNCVNLLLKHGATVNQSHIKASLDYRKMFDERFQYVHKQLVEKMGT